MPPSKFMFQIVIPAMTASLVNKQIHFKRESFHKGFSNLVRDLKGPLPHFVMYSTVVNSSQPRWALVTTTSKPFFKTYDFLNLQINFYLCNSIGCFFFFLKELYYVALACLELLSSLILPNLWSHVPESQVCSTPSSSTGDWSKGLCIFYYWATTQSETHL